MNIGRDDFIHPGQGVMTEPTTQRAPRSPHLYFFASRWPGRVSHPAGYSFLFSDVIAVVLLRCAASFRPSAVRSPPTTPLELPLLFGRWSSCRVSPSRRHDQQKGEFRGDRRFSGLAKKKDNITSEVPSLSLVCVRISRASQGTHRKQSHKLAPSDGVRRREPPSPQDKRQQSVKLMSIQGNP